MFKECILSKKYSTGLVLKYQKFVSKDSEYKEINYKIEVQYIVYGEVSKDKKGFRTMKQEWFFKHPVEAMAKFKCLKDKLDELIIKF